MAKHVDDEVIEQVRSSVDIVDVVGDYVQLTKRGRNYFGLCPFHGEQTPSFSVAQEKQIFHCFGCGAGGNVITFLMDIEGFTFQQTINRLAERTGLDLQLDEGQSSASNESTRNPAQDKWRAAHTFAASYYHHLLLNTVEGEEALDYLKNRGIDEETIKKFQIGYSMPGWDNLTLLLQQRGYEPSEMEKCGLLVKQEEKERYFDRFRNRIMFPIMDDKGQVIAFSGRILEANADEAKYLNSPESELFQKNDVLYNMHHARVAIRMKKQVIISEGFLDVIAFSRAGIDNVIGTMGTALTQNHITRLKRLTSQFVFCFDGDKAGMEATKKAFQATSGKTLQRSALLLPNQSDPDDYSRQHGLEALAKLAGEKGLSEMAFSMVYYRKGLNLQNDSDVLHYTDTIITEIAKSASPIEQSYYVKQLAEEVGIGQDVIEQQLRKQLAKRAKSEQTERPALERQPVVKAPAQKLDATSRAEYLLLAHLLDDPTVFRSKGIQEDMELFVHDELVEAFLHLLAFYEKYPTGDFQRLLEVTENPSLKKVYMFATMLDKDPESSTKEIEDSMRQLRKYRVEKRIEALMHESKVAEKLSDYTKALELATQAIELKRTLHTI